VLFIGTPCQVSALNNYIGKEYANLITVDFVCHGVQSHKVFNKFLSSLGEADSPLLVEFRNKDHGYDDTKGRNEWNVVFPHKNIKASTDKGAFLWFASSLSLRASCYGCSFSAQKRCSDITVADYTGKDLTEEDKRIGVSTVLVNTKKGEALLENCKAEIVTEEKVLDCVLRSYKRLNGKTRAPRCRKAFFKDLQELDYTALTEKYTLKKILPSKIVRRLDGLKKRLGF